MQSIPASRTPWHYFSMWSRLNPDCNTIAQRSSSSRLESEPISVHGGSLSSCEEKSPGPTSGTLRRSLMLLHSTSVGQRKPIVPLLRDPTKHPRETKTHL